MVNRLPWLNLCLCYVVLELVFLVFYALETSVRAVLVFCLQRIRLLAFLIPVVIVMVLRYLVDKVLAQLIAFAALE